jgi:RecA/RadA recombinase
MLKRAAATTVGEDTGRLSSFRTQQRAVLKNSFPTTASFAKQSHTTHLARQQVRHKHDGMIGQPRDTPTVMTQAVAVKLNELALGGHRGVGVVDVFLMKSRWLNHPGHRLRATAKRTQHRRGDAMG